MTLYLLSLQPSEDTARELERLAATTVQSTRVGELLGTLLKKEYPHILCDARVAPTTDNLLRWQYWPTFIKFRGMCVHIEHAVKSELL